MSGERSAETKGEKRLGELKRRWKIILKEF
jgi:hypothetical protein